MPNKKLPIEKTEPITITDNTGNEKQENKKSDLHFCVRQEKIQKKQDKGYHQRPLKAFLTIKSNAIST